MLSMLFLALLLNYRSDYEIQVCTFISLVTSTSNLGVYGAHAAPVF